jgi:hypothetical protein
MMIEVRQSSNTSARATTITIVQFIDPPPPILSFPFLNSILYITNLDFNIFRFSNTIFCGTREAASKTARQLPLLGHRLRTNPLDRNKLRKNWGAISRRWSAWYQQQAW